MSSRLILVIAALMTLLRRSDQVRRSGSGTNSSNDSSWKTNFAKPNAKQANKAANSVNHFNRKEMRWSRSSEDQCGARSRGPVCPLCPGRRRPSTSPRRRFVLCANGFDQPSTSLDSSSIFFRARCATVMRLSLAIVPVAV